MALVSRRFRILDYRSDGRRRGFPFDPYLLYLHRRLLRADEAADRLLGQIPAAMVPSVLRNFQGLLAAYRQDTEIRAAADFYERACTLFTRLREALRLSATDMDCMRQPQELPRSKSIVYLELVLGGSLESLPTKLAEASRDAGSLDAWRRRRRPRLLGDLPRSLLRADGFLDDLLDVSARCCHAAGSRAA